MAGTFFRISTDRTEQPVPLENLFAGPTPSACFLIGGGPSLARLPCDEIARAPVPKMAVNLAGTRRLRPTFWTAYDPTARFHRSIYLDPGVLKFVHRRRAMDLVPETTYKVCDCPGTLFFDHDGERGFADFLSQQARGIVDWADSLVQAIDILYRLGFRVIYLAGCEMRVRPSKAQIARAATLGVRHDGRELLRDFVGRCERAGLSAGELEALGTAPQYHFDESKPLPSAVQTDKHYFRIAQSLRLSRRSLALAGVQLVSVTPHSRLNDHFPYLPVRRVLNQLRHEIGDPATESVRGLYHQNGPRHSRRLDPMRDVLPHHAPPPHPAPPPTAFDPNLGFVIEAEGPVPIEDGNFGPPRQRLLDGLRTARDGLAEICEDG